MSSSVQCSCIMGKVKIPKGSKRSHISSAPRLPQERYTLDLEWIQWMDLCIKNYPSCVINIFIIYRYSCCISPLHTHTPGSYPVDLPHPKMVPDCISRFHIKNFTPIFDLFTQEFYPIFDFFTAYFTSVSVRFNFE